MLLAFLIVAVPLWSAVVRRLPLAYGVYAIAALALPLSYPVALQPLMSCRVSWWFCSRSSIGGRRVAGARPRRERPRCAARRWR